MTKFNYFKISKTKKIRYLKHFQKNTDYIVFLHGFMSDLEGKKPKTFLKFAKENKLGFLALEYSGHGKSSGKFTNGNISKWTKETSLLIKRIVKTNKIIFIGSSMGAWISLNQFKLFKKQIKGFLGIGSAPEFLENLMWKKFDKKTRKIILDKKIYNLEHGEFIYPITKQLIFDGRKNKVLNNKINLKIPISLFHGKKDIVVPINYSRKILKFCKKSKKKLILIPNGKHSLSRKSDLKKICRELKNMTKRLS